MAQTAQQKASVAATVAKVKAANQAKNAVNTQQATPVAPTTPVNTQTVVNSPIEVANAVQKAQSTGQQTVNTQQVTPVEATQPNVPVTPDTTKQTEVAFGQQAQQQNAIDPMYLDKRNSTIAEQINNQLKYVTSSGQRVTGATRDGIIQQVIAQNGGQVDFNSPDWQNTIDDINRKVLGINKASTWDSLYGSLNRNIDKAGRYTDGVSLYEAINKGDVTSQQLEVIKTSNPALYAEYKKKQEEDMALALVNGKKPEDNASMIEAIMEKFGLNSTSTHVDLLAKRDELFNNPELKDSESKYLEDKGKLLELQDTYDGVEEDVRKEYEGTGATESYIQYEINKRQKPVYRNMQQARRNYTLSMEDYNIKVGNAKDEMDLYQKQFEIDNAERSAKMQAVNFAMDIMSFETPEQKDQRAWDSFVKQQDYMNVNIAGKDYFMDKDGNITNISLPSDFDVTKGLTGSQASSIIMTGGVSQLAETMEEGKQYNCGDRGQCGEWYNDAVGKANGTAVGNDYSTKTKFVDQSITVGEAGMGVVYNFGGQYEKEGHIGVLASGLTTKNGTFGYYVISANAKGNEKLSKDFVPEGLIAGSRGGFIPTKIQSNSSVKSYTDSQYNIVKGMDIKNLSKLDISTLASNGLTPEDAYNIKAKQSSAGDTPEAIKEIVGLRKELNGLQEVKNYRTIEGQYNTVKSQANSATPAGDLSLIFSYMKMLDPNSTVKEGEFANAQNAGSVGDKLINMYEKVRKGTRLTDTQRKDFVASAEKVYRDSQNTYNQRLKEYQGYITLGGDANKLGSQGDADFGRSSY